MRHGVQLPPHWELAPVFSCAALTALRLCVCVCVYIYMCTALFKARLLIFFYSQARREAEMRLEKQLMAERQQRDQLYRSLLTPISPDRALTAP